MSTNYIGKCTQSAHTLGTHTSGQIYRQSMILEAADIKFSFVRDITYGDKNGHIQYFIQIYNVYVCFIKILSLDFSYCRTSLAVSIV